MGFELDNQGRDDRIVARLTKPSKLRSATPRARARSFLSCRSMSKLRLWTRRRSRRRQTACLPANRLDRLRTYCSDRRPPRPGLKAGALSAVV